ncbi:MAG: diadenylate cyclase CdaA [Calditrichia bacterium]
MIDLFHIGFLPITLIDFVDIFFVTLLFYYGYMFIRGTIAARMMIGLIMIITLSVVIDFLDMSASRWIFSNLKTIWLIAFVILFQPELRRLLLYIGQNPVVQKFVKNVEKGFINEVVEAAVELSRKNIGALIVLVRRTGLKSIVEGGVPVEARATRQLLVSIFYPRSPLHDGAVIIRNDIIEAAKCILPLATNPNLEKTLGTRHRAAIGLTEQSDAIVVVVSEETGKISVAEHGKIEIGITGEMLKKRLEKAFMSQTTEKTRLSDIFTLGES